MTFPPTSHWNPPFFSGIRQLFWGWQRRNSQLLHKTTNNKTMGTYFAYRKSPLDTATFLNDPTVSGVSVKPCLQGRVLPPKSSDLEMVQRQLKKLIERSFLNVEGFQQWRVCDMVVALKKQCDVVVVTWGNTTQLKWPHRFDRGFDSIPCLEGNRSDMNTWLHVWKNDQYMPFEANWI